MTKAERIYKQTRAETVRHIKAWGYNPETDGGWAGGWVTVTEENPDGESVYQRTQNALLALLDRDRKNLKAMYKFNIGTPERRELEANIVTMLTRTAHNQYISGK